MDFNGVSLFARVVEAGSFTRAAAQLGITTSGASRAVMRLEAELGVRLLQRTTRKLSLTAAGRAYFDQVRGALAMLEEAGTAATEMGEEPRGSVRLTAPPALAGALIPFVAAFLLRYPQIVVQLSCSQGIVDLVEEGFDLALRLGRLRDSSLVARRVGHLVTGLFASRGYVARNGLPRTPADLAKHDCVLFRSQGGKATWRLTDGEHEQLVEVTGRIEVDEIPSLQQAVLNGIGIGSISFFSSARMRGLVRVLPRYVSGDLPVSLVSPSKRLEPARVVLLRDFLAAKLASLRWRG
ncbi:MAG TPA: LysR family transcriptional regulator [Candidatus Binataceae bacterium]|nr:LysR family transcriptional regulator [Candidatus Binataceae bacterium]